MEKSIHSPEHQRLCALLRETRQAAGLRQYDVAKALDITQSRVSSYEMGERRLDIIELRKICDVLGLTLGELVERFEAGETKLGRSRGRRKPRPSTRTRR